MYSIEMLVWFLEYPPKSFGYVHVGSPTLSGHFLQTLVGIFGLPTPPHKHETYKEGTRCSLTYLAAWSCVVHVASSRAALTHAVDRVTERVIPAVAVLQTVRLEAARRAGYNSRGMK